MKNKSDISLIFKSLLILLDKQRDMKVFILHTGISLFFSPTFILELKKKTIKKMYLFLI